MTTTQMVVLLLVLAIAVAAGWFVMRHLRLRRRFGPEYEQVAADQDSWMSAERELLSRERRHRELELRSLDPATQDRYARAWQAVQSQFVTDPAGAVVAGDELVTQLVRERGYPTEDFEDELSYLSVDHARVLSRYRDAHEVYLRGQRGEADTEDLRQALVHYRALFADLLGSEPVPAEPVPAEPVPAEPIADRVSERDTTLATPVHRGRPLIGRSPPMRAADNIADREAHDKPVGDEVLADSHAAQEAVDNERQGAELDPRGEAVVDESDDDKDDDIRRQRRIRRQCGRRSG